MGTVNSYHYSLRIFAFAIVLLCLASCTFVEFSYDDVDGTPNKVNVSVSITWSSDFASEEDIPEKVTVLMSRIVNEVHYVWDEDRYGTVPDEEGEEGVEGEAGEEGEESEENGTVADRIVLVGDYYAIAYGFKEGTYEIEGLENFRTDNGFGMTSIKAILPTLDKEDLDDRFGNMKDFNPALEFVGEAAPLGLSVIKPTILAGSGSGALNFQMKDRTLRLTIRLKLISGEGVQVNRIVADLSGVPREIGLMSGLVFDDKTGKIRFEMEKVSEAGAESVYEAVIRTAGLFPASSDSLRSGNGILRLELTASCNGVSRSFFAGINMKREIEEAKLMQQTTDKKGYRVICNDAEITIGQTIKVSKDQIESAGDDSLSEWFEDKDINIEW